MLGEPWHICLCDCNGALELSLCFSSEAASGQDPTVWKLKEKESHWVSVGQVSAFLVFSQLLLGAGHAVSSIY